MARSTRGSFIGSGHDFLISAGTAQSEIPGGWWVFAEIEALSLRVALKIELLIPEQMSRKGRGRAKRRCSRAYAGEARKRGWVCWRFRFSYGEGLRRPSSPG